MSCSGDGFPLETDSNRSLLPFRSMVSCDNIKITLLVSICIIFIKIMPPYYFFRKTQIIGSPILVSNDRRKIFNICPYFSYRVKL